MRTLGIDLSVKGTHKAIVANERGRYVSPILKCHTTPSSLHRPVHGTGNRLLSKVQNGTPDEPIQAVMEPTGMAWFPMSVYLIRQGVTVFLVNSQQVADLRRYYRKHAKSDRIDCRVLAKLPVVDDEKLHPLEIHEATALACQRGCKELERLNKQCTAVKNRLIAMDRFAWPGLKDQVFDDLFSPVCRWFRENWYNPAEVCQAGEEFLRQTWQESDFAPRDSGAWIPDLVSLAEQVMDLYGMKGSFLDFDLLQEEAAREQKLLSDMERMHHRLKINTVRPLCRQLHPSRNLETIPGVGQDGAAVFASFIGNPHRFPSLRQFRGWSGMVPYSKQSSDTQIEGLKITQAGPRLIKKFAYLDADVARQYDPQLAARYYDQMVKKGKHHVQAVCNCATHLLNRILVILREDRPYQLRDVDGTPVSKKEAREIIAERYTVPEEVRQSTKKNTRKAQVDKRAERLRKRERESRAFKFTG